MTKRKEGNLYIRDLQDPGSKRGKTISLLSDNEGEDITSLLIPSSPGVDFENSLKNEHKDDGQAVPELEDFESLLKRSTELFPDTKSPLPDTKPPLLDAAPQLASENANEYFPGMIDFSVKNGDFKSNANLTSSDGFAFYSDMTMPNGNSKIPFTKTIINLLLNFMQFKKFDRMIREDPDFKISSSTAIELWKCAIYLSLSELEKLCVHIFDNRIGQINDDVAQLYMERKQDKHHLYKGIIEGRISFDADLSKQFLSDCCDFGFEHKQFDGLILNVIPWYVMSDTQMGNFKKVSGYEPLGFQQKDTMKRFLELFRKRPTDGSVKLLYRIAELRYG